MHEHDNLCAIRGDAIEDVEMVKGSLTITDGQEGDEEPEAFENPIWSELDEFGGKLFQVKVRCGRKGSNLVRDLFFGRLHMDDTVIDPTNLLFPGAHGTLTDGDDIKKMNFYVKLRITLKGGEAFYAYLGQCKKDFAAFEDKWILRWGEGWEGTALIDTHRYLDSTYPDGVQIGQEYLGIHAKQQKFSIDFKTYRF